MLRLLVNLTERYPAFRRWAWKRWYQHIAGYKVASWSLMNYGYQPLNADRKELPLEPADQDDRLCIQLYDRVARGIDVTGLDLLEVGSGRGGGASYVQRYLKPKSMTGVDFSSKAVSFCQSRHQVAGLSFCTGDAENLPFETASFDAVINVESSHCYGSMSRFLNEVVRVLKPAGYFLLTDFRTREEQSTLEQQLRDAGLVVVEEEDITANVVKAMELDSERKQQLIRSHIRSWLSSTFEQFAGVENSEVLNSFRDGTFVYMRYVLRARD